MLSSISPLGERARASRWWLTTPAYVLARWLGGLALGAARRRSWVACCPTRGARPRRPWCSWRWPCSSGWCSTSRVGGPACPSGVVRSTRRGSTATAAGCRAGLRRPARLRPGHDHHQHRRRMPWCCSPAARRRSADRAAARWLFGLVRALPSLFMVRVTTARAASTRVHPGRNWAQPAEIAARVALTGAAVVVGAGAVATVTGSGWMADQFGMPGGGAPGWRLRAPPPRRRGRRAGRSGVAPGPTRQDVTLRCCTPAPGPCRPTAATSAAAWSTCGRRRHLRRAGRLRRRRRRPGPLRTSGPARLAPSSSAQPAAATAAGASASQHFFSSGGRGFCLFTVIGSHARRMATVPRAAAVRPLIQIADRPPR